MASFVELGRWTVLEPIVTRVINHVVNALVHLRATSSFTPAIEIVGRHGT